jgi:hypothetical protein
VEEEMKVYRPLEHASRFFFSQQKMIGFEEQKKMVEFLFR